MSIYNLIAIVAGIIGLFVFIRHIIGMLISRPGGRLMLVRVYDESEVEEVAVGEYQIISHDEKEADVLSGCDGGNPGA